MNIDDDKAIDYNTFYARQLVEKAVKALEHILVDPDSEQRHREHECPVCFYMSRSGRIVGHGNLGGGCHP